jgi:signal transduction histidine kinase
MDPDALAYPPIDVVVYQISADGLRTSPGAPAEPVDPQGLVAPPEEDHVVSHGGREYLVRTYRTGSTTTQVALDLSGQERERHRLYVGLAAAGAAGILLAGGLGALIARRAVAPLGQAISRQRRFVADASHELRTPLTQLHMRAQLLDQRLRSEPEVADDAAALVRGTRQMAEILDELLASAELGALPEHRKPVDLYAVAQEVVEAEQVRAAEAGVGLALVSSGRRYVVLGTVSALRRVLTSLVDNALHHTPEGGRISVELTSGEQTVRARVIDTGKGFDPAQAHRIFERFHRADHGDGRRYGLGLALAHEVVTSHGGTIAAESTPGTGSSFTVDLPALPSPTPQRPRSDRGRGARA